MRARFRTAALVLAATLLSAAAQSAPKGAASASASVASAAPTGKLNREEFEAALRPVISDIHACYNKALNKDSVAEGTVILVVETRGGKALNVDTDRHVSTMKLEDAHTCIIGVVKKMKFPLAKNADGEHDPKAIALIRYPLEFSLGIGEGSASITGATLDHERVKKIFSYEKLAIGRCYLEAKKALKGAAAVGKLVLRFSVVGGVVQTVDEVASDTTLADKEMKACIFGVAKKFKFPVAKNAKGVEDDKAASVITYPIDFTGK